MNISTYIPSRETLINAANGAARILSSKETLVTLANGAGLILSTINDFRGRCLAVSCMAGGFTSLSLNIIKSYREGEISHRSIREMSVAVAVIACGYMYLSMGFDDLDRFEEGFDSGRVFGVKEGVVLERDKWVEAHTNAVCPV